MTREQYLRTGWNMSFEEFNACDCSKCDKKTACKHANTFRRVPVVDGGLGLCSNLQNVSRETL